MFMMTIIALIFTYLLVSVYFYYRQDSMLFFPEKVILQTPKNIGLEYEEISLTTKDNVVINGWFVPAENEKGVVLFCHGNAGNLSDRLDSIKIFHDLGQSVLIFDYRGYGRSGGTISEKGTYLDAEAAWDYLNRGQAQVIKRYSNIRSFTRRGCSGGNSLEKGTCLPYLGVNLHVSPCHRQKVLSMAACRPHNEIQLCNIG